MSGIVVRAKRDEDNDFLRRSLLELMAGTEVAGHGELIDAMPLPGLIASAVDSTSCGSIATP